jgi:hypothetical protein
VVYVTKPRIGIVFQRVYRLPSLDELNQCAPTAKANISNAPTPQVPHTNTDMSVLKVSGEGNHGPTMAKVPVTVS